MTSYKIIGIMSGTSLDGIDIVYAQLTKQHETKWSYDLLASEAFPFTSTLLNSLYEATNLSGSQLMTLDHDLGAYFGSCVLHFLENQHIDKQEVDAIASHGQTIFHQPAKGLTVQLGNPAVIAVKTGIKTIGDFRTKDVLYGGQGAPLVPIGDHYLFGDLADAFVNIGGFTNISYLENGVMKAFDVCPGNLPLNKLARAKSLDYDKNGNLARSGELNYFLLDLLNSLPFYQQEGPKSLGTEWLEQYFYPLLKFDKDIENNLATVVEHIADKIAGELNKHHLQRVLITGGGAKNSFLIERLKRYFKGELVETNHTLIDFKEALIFALLGALYLHQEPNCLASVTGASKNVCGGVIHHP
jgi:anhydro-N-acetylmuramic acid kinase